MTARAARSAAERLARGPGPVFIVGAPRSGTTLVRRLVDGHPDVAIAPETRYMPSFWARSKGLRPLRSSADFARLVEAVVASPEVARLGVDERRLRALIAAGDPSHRDLFASLLVAYGESHGARVMGEKTPAHARFVDRLLRWFPNARFIHVVRDPRAVVESTARVYWDRGSAANNALLWLEHVLPVHWATRACRERTFTLVYERLIDAPEAELTRVCRHLGLTFTPEMLRPRDDLVGAEASFKRQATRALGREGVARWRDVLSAEDVLAVEAVTGPWLAAFGYEATTPTSARLRAAVGLRATIVRGLPYLANNLVRREALRCKLGDVEGRVGGAALRRMLLAGERRAHGR